MSETARGASLALEASEPFGVAAHLRPERFDHHTVAQKDVARTVDCAHAALRDEALDLVLAVEHLPDQIGFNLRKHLAVARAEAHGVFKSLMALRAAFHAETFRKARAPLRKAHVLSGQFSGARRSIVPVHKGRETACQRV
jgi:hypothetical protein